MRVSIMKAWHQHLAIEVHDFGVNANEGFGSGIRTDEDDFAIADGNSPLPSGFHRPCTRRRRQRPCQRRETGVRCRLTITVQPVRWRQLVNCFLSITVLPLSYKGQA